MEEEKKEVKSFQKKRNLRRNIVILVIAIGLIVGYVALRANWLELSEIGKNYTDVFWTNLQYKSIVFAINFIVLFIVILFATKGIKKGLKTFFEEEKRNVPKLPNKSISLIISLIISGLMYNVITEKVMLIFNSARFEINDPIFGQDIGYYMFQKPFIELILFYIIAIIIGLVIYTGIYYIITFNVYFEGINRQTLKQSRLIKQVMFYAKILIITIGALVFVKTQNILFEKMLTLKDDNNTALYGASLVDVTIKLWGYRLLALIMIVSVFRAIKYIKEKNMKKTIMSLAVVPGYFIILFIVMISFQLIIISPNELDKEKQYIAYNIENTKNAYDINIDEQNIENTETISLEQINNNKNVLDNIAIVSKDINLTTIKEKQSNSQNYTYQNSQIGRYKIDGETKLVYLSSRELSNLNKIDYNKTYEYTHGYGAIITSATSTDNMGNIEYVQKTFDESDEKVNINEPRIYFGTQTNDVVVTNTKNKTEFDYPIDENKNAENNYKGNAGLKLNFLDRLVLGISEKNTKIIFSGDMTNESKILINRNIIKRAEKILPDIIYDEDPYQVVTDDGKLVWVLDGYTTSNEYPYSQSTVIERNGSKQRINYIRNSVKVIVDSYDGTVKFYITDRTDPIIMAYRNMYPTLFEDVDTNIPEDISKNIVYSKYLYKIQAQVLERYHTTKADVIYRYNDVWDTATHTTGKTLTSTGTELEPCYTMVKTINNDSEELGLVLPYTIYEKQSLTSYLIGTTDSNGNGKLTLYKFASDSNVLGPMQLDTQIEQDEEISKEIKALNVTGTKIIRNMIVVPIDNTLLYVEPIYQIMTNETEVPVLKKIIVASGNKLAIGDNLKEALENLSSQYAIKIEVSNTDNVEDLMAEIIKANKNLKTSNSNNDWEMIGKDMSELQSLIDKLNTLIEEEKKKEKDSNEPNTTSENQNTVKNVINNNQI